MNRGKDSLGCGLVLNALVAISIFVGIIFILGAGLKGCKCSSSSSSPGSTYHERQVNRLHEQRIQKDRENGWCEECHGKGTILFSPNSWEGPGFCEECNKEVKGSHPHVCKACNGTGKAK
jgi:RecJ-like exonuclease